MMEITKSLKEAILYYKQGKISKAINFFESSIFENNNRELVYESLGICYMEKGDYKKSLENFSKALKINNKNIKSSETLIDLLNFVIPESLNDNNILKANERILFLNNKITEEVPSILNIREILENAYKYSNEFISNINYKRTQIFRRNHEKLDCNRHFKIFNNFHVIPQFCFSCYKILIVTDNVLELIKLYFLFNQQFMEKSNLRKCMVEVRSKVKNNYKGFVYFKNPEDAENTLNLLKKKIEENNIKIKNIEIKHGCSEFYERYPDFKKINFKGEQEMKYNKDWEKFEKNVDRNTIKRSKEDEVYIGSSLNLLNLSDFLVIKNWLNYAKILGDTSYKQVFTNYIEDNFLNKILEKQYDFRKKEF